MYAVKVSAVQALNEAPPSEATSTRARQSVSLNFAKGSGLGESRDQANARANQIVESAKNEAISEATRQKELALAEIDAAANRAREQLRTQVSALAVAGAEKLLRKEIDANAHKALLDELASEI